MSSGPGVELKEGGDADETVESPGASLSTGVGMEGEREHPETLLGMGVGDFEELIVFLDRRLESGPASALPLTWFRYQPGYN